MYRVTLNYCIRSIGDDHDYDSDLDFSYIESIEKTYIYKYLEANEVLQLISEEFSHLSKIKSGEISICYMDED